MACASVQPHDDGPYCPTCQACGQEMLWEGCWAGCDGGYIDEYAEDPLWADPGDERPCGTCDGAGGWWICPGEPHEGDETS